jgi:hypothetical protein
VLSALALTFTCAPAASARTDVSPRIVNGSDATITDFPFQVLLFDSSSDPSNGRLCGGVVRDATHVVTAAHCVFDVFRPGQVSDPSTMGVLAGTADISNTASPAVQTTASQLSFDPNYDPSTNVHDVAIITLTDPLWTGGSPPPEIKPISIISHVGWTGISPGDPLVVSGWGDMTAEPPDGSGTPTFSDTLQKATVPLVSDTDCQNDYVPSGVPIDSTLLFCAGNGPIPITDSCQGDSGGPIVSGSPGSFALVGLVDSGIGCAQADFPGIYTRLDNTDLRAFFASDPPGAPSQNSATTLTGGNSPGQTLTCSSGDWTGSPSFTFQFFRSGSSTPLTGATPTNTYTVQQADVGGRIQCEVKAKNDGGFGFGESNSVLIPIPPPPPPPPPPPGTDTTPPTLHLDRKSCTKTACTLKVTVSDASPSSGIAKVKATLSFSRRVRCRSHGGNAARTCKKTVRRALTVTGGSGGKFTVVAKHLTPNTGYRVSLVPFDNAGNRPQFATVTNIRTKPRHARRL